MNSTERRRRIDRLKRVVRFGLYWIPAEEIAKSLLRRWYSDRALQQR